jgi:hypothetical protein
MNLKFKDRTWILLNRLIESGKKEGAIKHIEIPANEWKLLCDEWKGLNAVEQNAYIGKFAVKSNGISMLHCDSIMTDESFVDKWNEGEYDVTYRDVKLVPDTLKWTKDNKEKAVAAKEEVK